MIEVRMQLSSLGIERHVVFAPITTILISRCRALRAPLRDGPIDICKLYCVSGTSTRGDRIGSVDGLPGPTKWVGIGRPFVQADVLR